ncbi:nucleotidyl transferase AbiEii/AbiGii toxin family protein [Draconibacterium sediminis]|uniref:nucleotidyl transferase AbiEii/AbiGii toxin family protein n=1 Tax=Draconibacterium sediminis TaxID=1544798 RepID=UPI0034E97AA3
MPICRDASISTNLKFIFKGSTALMLMLPEPKRFSIDIDIIVPDKSQNIASNLDQVIANSDFIEYKLNERNTKSNIEKAHYKFYYKPITNTHSMMPLLKNN